ncbi:MAG: 23S rRNA (guanosine(2251)-2'-O)-methyltransferase RlmB [Bacteroidales bacterium]|nr:23S rRNA (guanosine(2251)-2'-O)-methyltransferase RlmB [Bacteroidales bacterium]
MQNKNKYYRPQDGLKSHQDFVFGTRAVIEAVLAGKDIDKIFVRKNLESDLFSELMTALKGWDIPIQRVPVEKLNRITMKNHQGVIALMSAVEFQKIEHVVPDLFEAGEMPFVVVLDGVTDVRNLGAIARTCDGAGVHAMVVPGSHTASINADAVKTSAGALHSLPVCRSMNLRDAVLFLKNSGLRIVAASEKSDVRYTQENMTGPIAIVMGAEDTGVSPEILKLCDATVSIPLFGKIASLNVSAAGGILLYEVVRQRNEIIDGNTD